MARNGEGARGASDDAQRVARLRAQLEAVFDSSDVGVALVDGTSRLVEVNPRLCDMLGHSRDELLRKKWTEIAFPDETGRDGAERRHLRKDGEILWAHVSARPLRNSDAAPGEALLILHDVSERRRNEERLRTALEASSDGYWERDLRTRKVFHSARMNEMVGLPAVDGIADDAAWQARLHPDDALALAPRFQAVREGREERVDARYRIRCEDGSWRWVHARGRVVERDGAGRPLRLAGTVTDVSAAKGAEQALTAAHEQIQNHLANTPLAVVEWDREYRVTSYSGRAEEMFGWSAAEVLGKRIDEVPWVPEEDWPIVRAVMDDMNRSARPVNVSANRNRRKDGTIIHCEWFNSSLHDPDGKLTSVFSLVQDVTARESARVALRTSEARFRALADASPAGIFESDLEGRNTFVNQALARIMGVTVEDALGREWLAAVHPEDRDRVVRTAHQDLFTRGSLEVEYRYLQPDGKVVWARTTARPLRDAAGSVTGFVGVVDDITERKAAADAQAASEKRYHDLVEFMPEGLFVVQDGRVAKSNAAAARLTGYGSVAEFEGTSPTQRLGPADLAKVENATRLALEGSVVKPFDIVVGPPGGRSRVIETTGAPILYQDRLAVQVLMRDVTEQRAVTAELAERERRMADIFEGSSDGYFEDDIAAGKRFRSPRTNELLGLPAVATEVDPRGWRQLIHPDDLPGAAVATGKLLDGGAERAEFTARVQMPDGAWRWRLVRMKVAERGADGKPVRTCGSVTDIDAMKIAEAALRRSEARFRALAEAAPVGIFEADASGMNVYMNRAASEILGMPHEAAQGNGWAGAIHPDDRERVLRELTQAVDERRVYASEHRFVKPGGDVATMRAYSDAIHDERGAVTGFVGVMIDVTQEKVVQQQVAVASRLGALGTLVAGVGHEINNPLAAIMAGEGYVLDVLKDLLGRLRSPRPPSLADVAADVDGTLESLEDGMESGRRIAQIVKDLAIFSGSNGSRDVVSLRAVVDTGLRWLPANIGKAAQVEVEDLGAPQVVGLPGQLSQVVLNLVSNACRAGRNGNVPKVKVRIRRGAAGQAVIEVVDDGIGMPPETIEKIFDPFFTTRPVGDGRGVGLGLSLCQTIIAAHGGTIGVKSEVGKGSTFTVELPGDASTPGYPAVLPASVVEPSPTKTPTT